MRLVRSLSTISTGVLVAVFYVHMQVELVKVSYDINCKEKIVNQMLDRQEALGYNIANLEDPSRLEGILSARKVDMTLPNRSQVFKTASVYPGKKRGSAPAKYIVEKRNPLTGIIDFFGLKAEAHAKER